MVPAGETLSLLSNGATHITTSCEDLATCVGESSWTNTSAAPAAVWVHASGDDGSRGAVTIAVAP